jgi:hypothetical protein
MIRPKILKLLEALSYRMTRWRFAGNQIMKPSEDPQECLRSEGGRALQTVTLQIEFRHPTHIGQPGGFTRPCGLVVRSREGGRGPPAVMLDYSGPALTMRVE